MSENIIVIEDIQERFTQAFVAEDDDEMDRLREYVDEIYRKVYNDIIDGKIDCAYYDMFYSKNGLYNKYIFHKSVRHNGIQKSCLLMYPDGKYVPVSHRDYETLEDMLEENQPGGVTLHCRKY